MIPKTIADPSTACWIPLFSQPRTEEPQSLSPDPSSPRARDARWDFATRSFGNPRGRPRGIPNPKRRVPDLAVRPPSARALSDLLDRKPHLLRPLVAQLMPWPLPADDPAERFGIDLAASCTAENCRQVLTTALAAIARGEMAPAEGARLARRVRVRLLAIRRRRAPLVVLGRGGLPVTSLALGCRQQAAMRRSALDRARVSGEAYPPGATLTIN
jgi:hypothetical protein